MCYNYYYLIIIIIIITIIIPLLLYVYCSKGQLVAPSALSNP